MLVWLHCMDDMHILYIYIRYEYTLDLISKGSWFLGWKTKSMMGIPKRYIINGISEECWTRFDKQKLIQWVSTEVRHPVGDGCFHWRLRKTAVRNYISDKHASLEEKPVCSSNNEPPPVLLCQWTHHCCLLIVDSCLVVVRLGFCMQM